jgi:ubiquinone/menaquinone biosynthesis C-methylase UbiE
MRFPFPMLEFIQRGYDVDGLDASACMLDRCRRKAEALRLDVTVYHQTLQQMVLPKAYRAMFLAGESFRLLTSDADARTAIRNMYTYLEPGGGVMIPLSVADTNTEPPLGKFREATLDQGTRLRIGTLGYQHDVDQRLTCARLLYERIAPDGQIESVERDFRTRYWPQDLFAEMLAEAGFCQIRAVTKSGETAHPDATSFIFLARR